MTKITFIGAGSLGFTSELVRDILTFPLLEDATISLMDIHAERLEWAKKGVEKLIAAGNRPAKVEATLDRAEALQRCGRCPHHNSRRQHGNLAARYRNPKEIWGGHQRRRHAWAQRHIPLPAHYQSHAGHRPGHGKILPGCGLVELHQSDGDVVRRTAATDIYSRHGFMPLRTGYGDEACGMDRRAVQ